jgi:hypothetical protein
MVWTMKDRKCWFRASEAQAVLPLKVNQVNPEVLTAARRSPVLVCLIVIGITVAAQALHLHPNELGNEAKHCTICQVTHAPVEVMPVAPVAVPLTASAHLLVSFGDLDPKQSLNSASLYCRPPPSA